MHSIDRFPRFIITQVVTVLLVRNAKLVNRLRDNLSMPIGSFPCQQHAYKLHYQFQTPSQGDRFYLKQSLLELIPVALQTWLLSVENATLVRSRCDIIDEKLCLEVWEEGLSLST